MINIFCGHFGSGKTEISINFALNLRKQYDKVAIVDLDIVNPYFRTADLKSMLKGQGIEVITPLFAGTNVDIPALTGNIDAVLRDSSYEVILDVGGDAAGAIALGRYFNIIKEYKLFLVVNTRRPFTSTKEEILEMASEIEESSRLKVTSVINNTNLSYETNIDVVLEGQKIIEETGLKLEYITGVNLEGLPDYLRKFAYPVRRYL